MARDPSKPNISDIAVNRRARHEYAVEDTFEAGLSLLGTEVKSLRIGQITFGDGYVAETNGELFLMNVHIAEYKQANRMNHEPLRPRKLLLHRREIDRIIEEIYKKGRSCIPLRFYLKDGKIKLELGIATGKKAYDKRQSLKERDARRDIARSRAGD